MSDLVKGHQKFSLHHLRMGNLHNIQLSITEVFLHLSSCLHTIVFCCDGMFMIDLRRELLDMYACMWATLVLVRLHDC